MLIHRPLLVLGLGVLALQARTPADKTRPPALAVPAPRRLAAGPATIRAVYFTNWSAGLSRRIDYLVDLHRDTEINAVVIDIKDYSGYIAYRTSVPQAQQYGAIRVTIRNIDALINRLHAEGMYAIARITAFQDPILARARPDLGVRRYVAASASSAPPLWLDRKGLAWIDPASRSAWSYLAAIAKDAAAHGFDELNFDYVRFPSDGNLRAMQFPFWDGQTPRRVVIRNFFRYLRRQLPGVKISADLFGLSTVNDGDLGIGQVIEDAYAEFDYVCPMVYPSHFARQFMNFANPAEHPYEVVHYTMKKALARLEEYRGSNSRVRLRPWLQDFNLGAHYDPEMVRAEIRAVHDALGAKFAGYMLWSPSNIYTRQALIPAKPREAARGPRLTEAHP